MIKSCQSEKLWNEGEDLGLGATGRRCSQAEGDGRKEVDKMRGEKEMRTREGSRWRGMY